jgi:predicted membrane protein
MPRGISLVLAGIAAIIGLIFPFLAATRPTALNQSVILIMLLGISGAFIHGVGFRIQNKWMASVTHPAFTWPLITAGAVWLFLLR